MRVADGPGRPFPQQLGPLQRELLPTHNRKAHMARNLAEGLGRVRTASDRIGPFDCRPEPFTTWAPPLLLLQALTKHESVVAVHTVIMFNKI